MGIICSSEGKPQKVQSSDCLKGSSSSSSVAFEEDVKISMKESYISIEDVLEEHFDCLFKELSNNFNENIKKEHVTKTHHNEFQENVLKEEDDDCDSYLFGTLKVYERKCIVPKVMCDLERIPSISITPPNSSSFKKRFNCTTFKTFDNSLLLPPIEYS
ncbi:hypothetical protein ABK040_003556 [Willaertia magna]